MRTGSGDLLSARRTDNPRQPHNPSTHSAPQPCARRPSWLGAPVVTRRVGVGAHLTATSMTGIGKPFAELVEPRVQKECLAVGAPQVVRRLSVAALVDKTRRLRIPLVPYAHVIEGLLHEGMPHRRGDVVAVRV